MGVIKYNNGIGVLNFPENLKPKCKFCDKKHFSKGLCSLHYYRDPEIKEIRKGYVEKRRNKNAAISCST